MDDDNAPYGRGERAWAYEEWAQSNPKGHGASWFAGYDACKAVLSKVRMDIDSIRGFYQHSHQGASYSGICHRCLLDQLTAEEIELSLWDELKKTLSFYADETRYQGPRWAGTNLSSVQTDKGYRARAVLAKLRVKEIDD